MNLEQTLVRAGLTLPKNVVEYAVATLLPAEYHYDAAHGQPCTDSYTHDIGAPEHLGDFVIVRETEHWCQGGTKRTIHVAPASSHRPHGGDIPIVLCDILRRSFTSHTPEQIWCMAPGHAQDAVKSSWVTTNIVAKAVMEGELKESWIPEGSKSWAGGMWLREALQASFSRKVNPLPLVRRLFPNCRWEYVYESVERVDRGMYSVYEPEDVVFACQVKKKGWVKGVLVGERTNAPL